MAIKKYIVKQIVDWNGRGDKTATFTFPCDSEAEVKILLVELEGRVEVYEQNLTLSSAPDANTGSMSINTIDKIVMRKKGVESVFVSSYNRPIVLKNGTNVALLSEALKNAVKPFTGAFVADKPTDVSIDTGNLMKL